MSGQPSLAAIERADRAIAAMASLAMDAAAIAFECHELAEGWSVLAVVDQDLRTTLYRMPNHLVLQRQPELEGAGWSVLFSAGTAESQIHEVLGRITRLSIARRDKMITMVGAHQP